MKVMIDTYAHTITDQETLIFRPEGSLVHLYSKSEGCRETHIATYSGGKWLFTDYQQQRLFFTLFNLHRFSYHRAFKAHLRKGAVKSNLYEFTCLRRRFTLKIIKITRKIKKSLF